MVIELYQINFILIIQNKQFIIHNFNYHTQHMSSPPRISFNKPNVNANPQPYSIYNSALPNNGYQSYETRPTTIVNPVTTPLQFSQKPQTIVVERSSVVEQIPRPQFEKSNIAGAPNKRLAPERDPVANSTCCTPCLWVIAALIGLAGLTFALLYGLNVIGGTNTQKVSVPVSPQASSATTTTTSTSTASATTTPTTASTAATISPTSASTSSILPTSNSSPASTNTGSTSVPSSSTSTPIQPGSIVPASIPAIPVTTTSHYQARESHLKGHSNEQQRHRLSVDE